jgi:3'-phosphoadenosine 5'-phosphosulfate sulfotransferase (PAPS reductase)/FAD synthetase
MIDIGNKHVVVHISGGGQSALCLTRCIEWYGRERVTAVFANTNTEAPDLYDFLEEIENHLGVDIVRLNNDGMDIWDIFDRFRVISIRGAGGACKASVELKQKPLRAYMENFDPESTAIALGMSWMEEDRQERCIKRPGLCDFQLIFPLNEKPRLSDCGVLDELRAMGLKLPEIYQLGYPHNNCGGGCILAGVRQWKGLLEDYPERFDYHENRERKWREETGHDFTVLRDFRGNGGKAKPYTLEQFRIDIENGRTVPGDFRTGCACMTLFEESGNEDD